MREVQDCRCINAFKESKNQSMPVRVWSMIHSPLSLLPSIPRPLPAGAVAVRHDQARFGAERGKGHPHYDHLKERARMRNRKEEIE